MSFIRFSSDQIKNSFTKVDNVFCRDYLINAPSEYVKVYIYSIYLSTCGDVPENEFNKLAETLQLQENDIWSAFQYWENLGLLKIYDDPPKIIINPTNESIKSKNKWYKSKYEEFNLILQDIKQNNMIQPSEYSVYYDLMEKLHIEIPAMLEIIKFCVNQQGEKIGYKYVSAIANDWAKGGVLTAEAVEKKICEYFASFEQTKEIITALKSKRKITYEDRQFYDKWLKVWGFKHEVIIYVAENIKKQADIYRLDNNLKKYYEMKLFDIIEIQGYEQEKQNIFELSKKITSTLGVYYENLENVVDTYTQTWLNKGYDEKTLLRLAQYCFLQDRKTLSQLNDFINKLYKEGVVNNDSINEYFEGTLRRDIEIKEILEKCGLSRNVTTWDRDAYRTWTYNWDFKQDLLLYCAECSTGKNQPIAYMNKMLSNWHDQKINSVEMAKKTTVLSDNKSKPQNENKARIITREYTKEELNSVFSNLDDLI